ncbi:MAG: hypothetical protein M3524_09750 [Actinomycetota bacterium]|nr:hypothetical protein [Actinomycetota bacterium]
MTLCPTTGLVIYSAPDVAAAVADGCAYVDGRVREVYACPDEAHWHVRLSR